MKKLVDELIIRRQQVDDAENIFKEMKSRLNVLEDKLLTKANELGLSSFKREDGVHVIFASRDYFKIVGGQKNPEPRRKLLKYFEELGYGDKIFSVPEMVKKDFDAVMKELPINTKISFVRDKLLSHEVRPVIQVRGLKKKK